MKFAEIPEWAVQPEPSVLSFFETIALAGLEDKWIRLSADTQRALLGFPVFGKIQIKVRDGEVLGMESVCFGTDRNIVEWGPERIKQAVSIRTKLRVG